MSIVAISDTLGSRGDTMGRELARRLRWEFADRDVITKAAEQFGEAVGELHEVTETRPTLWERFTDSKRRYLLYVEATVFEMAARDHVVIVGHGAAIMLRDVRHALRVRVTAPERERVERARQRCGVGTRDAGPALRGFPAPEGHKPAGLETVRAVPGVTEAVDETVIRSLIETFPGP